MDSTQIEYVNTELLQQQLRQAHEVINAMQSKDSIDLTPIIVAHMKSDAAKKVGLYFSVIHYLVSYLEKDSKNLHIVNYIKQQIPQLTEVNNQQELV